MYELPWRRRKQSVWDSINWNKNRHIGKVKWTHAQNEILQCSGACRKQVSFYNDYNKNPYLCLSVEDLI